MEKKGIVTEQIPWMLIALIALVLIFIVIGIIKGEGDSMIDKIKNIFSFKNGN
jgi:fucose permease